MTTPTAAAGGGRADIRAQLPTVAALAAAHATERPGNVALSCAGRELTYRELHRESNRAAAALRADGLVRGGRVAYLGMDSEHHYALLLACAKAGTVLVPVNWRLAPAEVEQVLRDCGAELVFVTEACAGVIAEIRADLPALRRVVVLDGPATGDGFLRWLAGQPDTEPAEPAGLDEPFAQIYTSGTTGRPKGVVLSQRSFLAVPGELIARGLDWLDWRSDDRSLLILPGHHVGGPWWFLQGFRAGASTVVLPAFNSREAATVIRELRITTTLVVPAILHMLLEEPGTSGADFAALRKVVYGGSPIAEPLLRRCLERWGCAFAQIYGLTETGAAAICLAPADHVAGGAHLAATGRPLPGVQLKIIDGAGRELPAGEIGEVCLHTPGRMIGYWGLPEATAQTLVDGWIHTGDAGLVDADGYLQIRDRIKNMIIVAGENVYPAEIEGALSAHPAVAEVAVIGVPDERWGEAAHAVVVLRPGQHASPRDLMLALRGRIADFKIPARYEFVDELPHTASGKIERRVLRDRYWAGRSRNVN